MHRRYPLSRSVSCRVLLAMAVSYFVVIWSIRQSLRCCINSCFKAGSGEHILGARTLFVVDTVQLLLRMSEEVEKKWVI